MVIPPKFIPLFAPNKFENIITISEENKGKWESYYLTKSGKIVGRDSLFVFDNGFNYENEGFIQFKDPQTKKKGMLKSQG